MNCWNPCNGYVPTPPVGGPTAQRHVHEVLGSVMIAGEPDERHNHRFASISGEAVIVPEGHVHVLDTRTDFYDEHLHHIVGTSGPAIQVGDRHVHYLNGQTTTQDGHFHQFRAAALIENPLGD